jgi:sugar lactone lactonase YvrE
MGRGGLSSRAARSALGTAAVALALAASASAPPAVAANPLPTQLPGTTGCIAQGQVEGCAVGRALAEPPGALAISPDGKSAYLVAADPERIEADALDVFDRDPTSGALTQKPGGEGCRSATGRDGCTREGLLADSNNVAVSPDGLDVYVATGSGIVGYSRDATSGALTPLTVPGPCLGGAAVRTPCKSGTGLEGAFSLAFSPDGRELYVGSSADPVVATLRRDPTTGYLSQAGGLAGCVTARGAQAKCGGRLPEGAVDELVASADGRSLYAGVFDGADGSVVAFVRKPSGALRRVTGKAGCFAQKGEGGCRAGRGLHAIDGLALSPDGRQLYVASAAPGYGGSIAILRRGAGGALSQPGGKSACIAADGGECARATSLPSPLGIAVSPDGANLYAATLDGLAVLTREPTGLLAQAPGAAGCLSDFRRRACTHARNLEATNGVTVSPDGANVYVTSFEPGGVAAFAR